MANYIEYIFVPNFDTSINSNNLSTFDINVPEEQFVKLLHVIMSRYHNHFEKLFQCILRSDLVLENYAEKKDINSYKKEVIKTEHRNNNIIVLHYNRNKIPFHMFDSNTDINSLYYCRRLTFRVLNRVYINFDTQLYSDETIVRKIYVNYNHDDNVDMENINMTINTILNILTSQ